MSVERAIALFRSFFGREPEPEEVVTIEAEQTAVGIVIGSLRSLTYVPTGGDDIFEHVFTDKQEPDLVISADGDQILTRDGVFQFTGQGFVG